MLVGLSCGIPFVYKWHFDVVPNLLGKPVICPECNYLTLILNEFEFHDLTSR